jgi:hypothetical protein
MHVNGLILPKLSAALGRNREWWEWLGWQGGPAVEWLTSHRSQEPGLLLFTCTKLPQQPKQAPLLPLPAGHMTPLVPGLGVGDSVLRKPGQGRTRKRA